MLRFALVVAFALMLAACSHPEPDATPEGVLRTWLDRMDATTDPHEAKAAYGLLGPTTRKNLERRAERASRIEGHQVEPYEVLAEGRFALRFRPKRFTTITASPTQATVEVTGAEATSRASLHCVKEGRGWRVELDLPEMVEPTRRDISQ